MIQIGINGFGRIGKCIFLQLLQDPSVSIRCINAPVLEMKYLEQYLKYDSVHHYSRDFNIIIIDDNTFSIEYKGRGQIIHVFRDRNAKNLNWRDFNISFVMDCTGAYLTTEKCLEHDVDFIMMSAPPKDSTKTFVYGVNHHEYQGEKIISAASCTTNCITPILKWVHDELGGIVCGNFTTIHATTASQHTVDILNKNTRTNRSILNNIIPHTTGASSAIAAVIPELKGKIHGTSLRVPVSNVSLVDLNVECGNTSLSLNDVLEKMREIQDERKDVIMVTKDTLVSCDFITTTHPSIVDCKASLDLGDGKYKLMIWYDNEWSYSAQMIRMMKHILSFQENKYQIKMIHQMNLKEKNVVLRVDFNVPILHGMVTDEYRITSALPTIKEIIKEGAKRLILVSHLGRPKEKNQKDSLKILLPILQKYLGDITFLPNGIHPDSIYTIEQKEDDFDETKTKIYLLENIRFHPEETDYEKKSISQEFKDLYSNLGDVFINDAFGCSHRKHFSICGFTNDPSKETGYGYLIQKEIESLNSVLHSKHKKTLVILGGAKIDDKVPILQNLCKNVTTIFLGGGILTSASHTLLEQNQTAIEEAKKHCQVIWANDGITSQNEYLKWKDETIPPNNTFYDIGSLSSFHLAKLIKNHDIIFWNGTMGYIEKDYLTGSEILINHLLEEKTKKIVIGGGDTAGFCNQYFEKEGIKTPSHWHISTGGGASIEYLSNGTLTGIKRI
jgi:glyceraldehyde 3-phosphate dehydrogenase